MLFVPPTILSNASSTFVASNAEVSINPISLFSHSAWASSDLTILSD